MNNIDFEIYVIKKQHEFFFSTAKKIKEIWKKMNKSFKHGMKIMFDGHYIAINRKMYDLLQLIDARLDVEKKEHGENYVLAAHHNDIKDVLRDAMEIDYD